MDLILIDCSLFMNTAIFKLKVQNVAFFAVAPTLLSKYCYQQSIEDRIDNLWRIHLNRQKKGLGGTANAARMYDDDSHTGDRAFQLNTGVSVPFEALILAQDDSHMFDNPFSRFHQSIQDYPHEHVNLDDINLFKTDNLERMKPLMPKEESVVGTTTLIPTADTDEKFIPADTQGENLYTNPPDPNQPFVDHALDEESIWNFRKTNYNQQVVFNPYTKDAWAASCENYLPWWGIKLGTPAFYKENKWGKFIEQHNLRLGLEILKMKHASELRSGDMK